MQRATTPKGQTEEYLARLKNHKFDKGKEPPWVTAYKTRAGKAVQVPVRAAPKSTTPKARLQKRYGRATQPGTPTPAGANSYRARYVDGSKVGVRKNNPTYIRNRP